MKTEKIKRGWETWSKPDLRQEILNRLNYFYNTGDGMQFPNSVEGDILKMLNIYLNDE
jgi:hypothetical protein